MKPLPGQRIALPLRRSHCTPAAGSWTPRCPLECVFSCAWSPTARWEVYSETPRDPLTRRILTSGSRPLSVTGGGPRLPLHFLRSLAGLGSVFLTRGEPLWEEESRQRKPRPPQRRGMWVLALGRKHRAGDEETYPHPGLLPLSVVLAETCWLPWAQLPLLEGDCPALPSAPSFVLCCRCSQGTSCCVSCPGLCCAPAVLGCLPPAPTAPQAGPASPVLPPSRSSARLLASRPRCLSCPVVIFFGVLVSSLGSCLAFTAPFLALSSFPTLFLYKYPFAPAKSVCPLCSLPLGLGLLASLLLKCLSHPFSSKPHLSLKAEVDP